MFARCTRSFANRLPLGRFALPSDCEVACSRAPIVACSTDMSALLLLQDDLRGNEKAEREQRKDERIEPEIGIAQSFGEGADADRLKPGRWKHQTDQSSLAGERGYRHEQT